MRSSDLLPGFEFQVPATSGDQLAAQDGSGLEEELAQFRALGTATRCHPLSWTDAAGRRRETPLFENEFWTARQRAAHSLHEISYRACFKPQLPRFFIRRLTRPGQRVYDPFMGRGTTLLEAALEGRRPLGTDLNPLSQAMIRPRLEPPEPLDIEARLAAIPLGGDADPPRDLRVFYHPDTLREICALRHHLLEKRRRDALDEVDRWIAMVALNRLTGHSPGFFSVYTLPPNQSVSVASQRRINQRRGQVPPRRDVRRLILKKSRQLLKDCDPAVRDRLSACGRGAMLLMGKADGTPEIADASVELVVTSPPFLNVVNYAQDNWLRCWFLGHDASSVRLTTMGSVKGWAAAMTSVFRELRRLLVAGGHVAFEVGEIRKGALRLETVVLPCGAAAGLEPRLVLVNAQRFTKTANCWGVSNNAKGTNTNRVVLFRRPVG